jgi:lipoprotein-anchoring transpeptidase ErfK/SrfK
MILLTLNLRLPMQYFSSRDLSRRAVLLGLGSTVAACAAPPPPDDAAIAQRLGTGPQAVSDGSDYGVLVDGEYTLPGVPARYLEGVNRRAIVAYPGDLSVGTIEVDPHAKFLYWIEAGGMARRYPIAVGREGRGMSGTTVIRRKVEWPGWTPTPNMLRREPAVYGPFRGGVPGGLSSPLGARALYLYRGGRDTFYRIHGTNDLTSIGNSGSAGCIRLFNHDAIDLFDRVPLETRVVVRTYAQSVRIEGEALANRGVELPPVYVTPEELGL